MGQGLRELDSSRCFRVEAQPRREGGTLRIWEHTFETLTGSKQPIPGPDLPIPAQPFDVDHVVPITTCPRFATAPVEAGGSMTHQALLELMNGQWVCVGSYVDDTIYLEPDMRGRGACRGTAVAMCRAPHFAPVNELHPQRIFTP